MPVPAHAQHLAQVAHVMQGPQGAQPQVGDVGASTYSCLIGGIVKSRLHGDMVIGVGASKGQLQGWLPLEPVGNEQLEWVVEGRGSPQGDRAQEATHLEK